MKTNPDDLINPIQETTEYKGHMNALTKREHFASMAMQALLSYSNHFEWDQVAKESVKMADRLIKQLNETKYEN